MNPIPFYRSTGMRYVVDVFPPFDYADHIWANYYYYFCRRSFRTLQYFPSYALLEEKDKK